MFWKPTFILAELQLFKMTEYSVIVTMKMLGTAEKSPDH